MKTGYYISPKDYNTIINYAKAAYSEHKCEIGGMSICYQDKDSDWIVTDPVILKQEIAGSTCDLDQDALADYYCNAQKKHGKKNFRFCWWHSHHNMGVFWSGTDIKGIEEYSDGDMSFALVVNLKRENKFRISLWKPVAMYLDTELQLLGQGEKEIPKKIVDEVNELCTTRTYTSYKKGDSTYNRHQTDIFDDNNGYSIYSGSRINHGTNLYPRSNGLERKDYNTCYEFITEMIESLVNEGMEYSKYIKEAEKFNNNLKKLGSLFSIQTIPLNEIKPELAFEDPELWIGYNGETMEVLQYNGIYY